MLPETARVPSELRQAAASSAAQLGPFVTVDFAQAKDGSWFCLEAGDGGVSGPAVSQDLRKFWAGLKSNFEMSSGDDAEGNSGGVEPILSPSATLTGAPSKIVIDIHRKVLGRLCADEATGD